MLRVGDGAPGFSATTDDGNTLSLEQFRGRKVVLYFYPKDETPGCTKEACDFRDSHSRLLRAGAVVLGVSADSVESHAAFRDRHGLPFPLISDPDRTIIDAYGARKREGLIGRTFLGVERMTFVIGEDGVVTHIFHNVKVRGHVEEVLAALAAGS